MMTATFVALDLETTGLDPETEAITEIGAVRFRANGEVVETFEQLVNPGRPIPAFIQRLTGVTDAAVRDAPAICDALPRLSSFVGADPVVGHNISFDLEHLARAGFKPVAYPLDTAELSRVLMPDRQPRGLSELATTLGFPPPTAHRALADAQTAANVFVALLRRAEQLPDIDRERLAALVALRDEPLARLVGGPAWQPSSQARLALPQLRTVAPPPPLARIEPHREVMPAEIDATFAAARDVLPGFEERHEQREMAAAVRSAFATGGHWLIEAGTGVGKSLAYLIPAALHALHNGERVVVSTNTINLQGQLLAKDIPALRRMLVRSGAIAREEDLRVALLKGRGNYLCLHRFHANYADAGRDPDFQRFAASLLLWLPRTETGDRQELTLDRETYRTWQRLSAEDADCLQRQNHFVRDGTCFLQRARQAAESAHLLIVNHALLVADMVAGGSAIPPFEHLIADEAHNLEDVATQQMGVVLSHRGFDDALNGIYHTAGAEGREGGAACLLRGLDAPLPLRGREIEHAVGRAREALPPFFQALSGAAAGRGDDDRTLITRGIRTSAEWFEVELAWNAANAALRDLLTLANAAQREIHLWAAGTGEPFANEIESAARRLDELTVAAGPLVSAPDDATIVWVARDREGLGTLNGAPLEVGARLWDELWSGLRTAVATSATLGAAGGMEYSVRRLGFERPETLQLGSPFDYQRAALVATFSDIPEPNDRGYLAATADAIVQLVRASRGRALALFTSHAALGATAELVRPQLEEEGIAVLAQGIDGNSEQLRTALAANPQTVILGTASFWEGVDIRGDALSLLIIARLPFAPPTDPIHEARARQYENGFEEYSLPSAILRFRQGFGRLIRDRTDRGVVAILDRRIWTKSYGRHFLAALPECTQFRGAVADGAREAERWLAR